jgi:peroxiredoxin
MSTLTARLAALRESHAAKLKPEISELLDQQLALLHQDPGFDGVPKVGERAPSFALEDQNGTTVSSTVLLARGPLVVSFYRGTWCPYCNEEIAALSEVYDAIRAEGASLVAVSPQSAASAESYRKVHPVPFPILVDTDARIAEQFGLAYTYSAALKTLYLNAFKNDLAEINAGATWRMTVPGRFVIDSDGIIADAQFDPDYRFRPDPADTLRVLRRLRTGSAA